MYIAARLHISQQPEHCGKRGEWKLENMRASVEPLR
jgi:hypothetical protein